MKSIKTINLIEKIEGEAKLGLEFKNGVIDFAQIEFFSSRNIENILQGKSALDALVINPRVCGICGHAHLIATVEALEACYEKISITPKAKILRELTLNLEIVQNHIKWLYLTIMPLLGFGQDVLKAMKGATIANKAIATIAGQYPHNSYAIVGGVVSEPSFIEIVKLKGYINELISFFESYIVKSNSNELLECDNFAKLFAQSGDLIDLLEEIKNSKLEYIGKSYDKFIVFGSNSYFKRGKSHKTRVTTHIDEKYIQEIENTTSLAKNVWYKEKYYEVGPLSRAMVLKTPLIKDLHRHYADSIVSRIVARVCEIPQLLHHSLKLIEDIDLKELSFIQPSIDISMLNGVGVSSVEAARGSLVHKVELKKGIIQNYTIITPTQWNLSNGSKEYLATAQKAIVGLETQKDAQLVFKSFDVCSVCTTH
jgi:hydrogenase large subunit